ncbi:MAG: hypothetical protein M1830_009084 [Pleopsidium flavum]|nr:MAG: hypothetical protein M1830_009084 [Pleopsidium flavum]
MDETGPPTALTNLTLSPFGQLYDSNPSKFSYQSLSGALGGETGNNGYVIEGLSRNGEEYGHERREDRGYSTLRADDIGYFDPHLDESMGKTNIVQAKAIANVKGSCLVRTSLHLCLRGVAQEWYAAELNDIQRDGLQGGNDVINWVNGSI